MKKAVCILAALALLCAMLPALAESYTPGEPDPEAEAQDYEGSWVCAYADIAGNMLDAQNELETLGMTSLLTLKIEDGMAFFTGMPELETEPLPMIFADGALCFQPEENVTVFTLQLLEDGALSMRFNMIEFGPVLYLFPAIMEPEA